MNPIGKRNISINKKNMCLYIQYIYIFYLYLLIFTRNIVSTIYLVWLQQSSQYRETRTENMANTAAGWSPVLAPIYSPVNTKPINFHFSASFYKPPRPFYKQQNPISALHRS